ncbi:hypothetical protein BXY66_1167 [Shimia isoporae]|uniref:Secreted protein n=1 Tax=Shimia isoporae TaxID=647720 RepID=A0A4R1NLI6_9RHOB|nr:DUF1223 domain-containing protein [Shimia isoporae]TCL09124.1 hypothetical protein BXY66_1167 [Shimia isoporae]
MTRVAAIFATVWCVLSGAVYAQTTNPVVVELYTSQGCSSCPPADEYLRTQLAGRDDVIALALHVDYWDYIGWKDNFADPAYTNRQKLYAQAAGHRSVYTPQMIVNGEDHVVGTHPSKVEKLINAHKAKAPTVELSVSRKGNRLRIEAEAATRQDMRVHIVRYLGSEKVSIKRGENAGKTLTYANIVDEWTVAKSWNGRSALKFEANSKGEGPVVVLVQVANGGPILAAARVE